LSPRLSADKLQLLLHDAGADTARVQVSNRMEAQLSGTGFAITQLSPGLQAVSSIAPAEWVWDVTPVHRGVQYLRLTLSAHIDVAGENTPLVVRTFERRIEVHVSLRDTLSSFVQDHWTWLWAAVLVPVAGYVWRRRRSRSST
jgi:hypothetical protein